ncbi:DME family drug/metabolite transporter [Desulfobaculum xiamenense]|uniref:DME family drug/metabolite transporter n=1 Tax=Desulfobaculum xiamenense TaxID=995050 RepID=A0A846QRZ9_9BACT|nr:DMT family transporter [Desulfobaculum xiamenense]NJB69143.1 DME family drug/metabolite transporter [Desulfobaculum xiamenense]
MNHDFSIKGALLVLGGALCFSTSGFAQALVAGDGASPLLIGAVRMLIGGLALTLWCAWRGILPKPHDWPVKNVALSALGLLLFQIFFFTGARAVGVAVGTVVSIGFSPICVAVLALVLLKERPVAAWYPATALAIAGLVLLNWTGAETMQPMKIVPSLAAGASYSLYIIFCKPLARHHAPETIMMVLLLICGLCLLPLFHFHPTDWLWTVKGSLVALDLGVVTSALAFCLMLAGLKRTPASTASTLGLAEPLSAAALGFLCLHEPMTTYSLVGMACILGSALLLILAPQLPLPAAKAQAQR